MKFGILILYEFVDFNKQLVVEFKNEIDPLGCAMSAIRRDELSLLLICGLHVADEIAVDPIECIWSDRGSRSEECGREASLALWVVLLRKRASVSDKICGNIDGT